MVGLRREHSAVDVNCRCAGRLPLGTRRPVVHQFIHVRQGVARPVRQGADPRHDRWMRPQAIVWDRRPVGTDRHSVAAVPSIDGGHCANALDRPSVHHHCEQFYLAVIRQRVCHADGTNIVHIAAASTADVGVDDQRHGRGDGCELTHEHLKQSERVRPGWSLLAQATVRLSGGATRAPSWW
eukprot:scaffold38883_cov63-Phaeocystis_antarctica.AAC.2